MIATQEKQKILQLINKMSMGELLELSDYTLRAMRNIHARGYQEEQTANSGEINVYGLFEQEFGRPLSPFEIEQMNLWMDQDNHNPVIIKAALREAVVAGKLNIRYIDKILFDWKKNGIKTVEQAREHSKEFRGPRGGRSVGVVDGETQPAITYYNWLEEA